MQQPKAMQLSFPIGGVMKRFSIQNQPPYTTPGAMNIRPEAVDDLRYKGGTRSGLAKHFTDQVGGGIVNLLSTVRWISSNVEHSTVVAAAAGILKYEKSDGTLSTAVSCSGLTTASEVISPTQLVHAASLLQKLYIADWDPSATTSAADRAPKVFDPSANTLAKITASDGTVPVGCPCVADYRGRLLLAGARANPHLLYGSRTGDPTDWDSGDVDPGDETGPFVLGASDAFTIGQPITAIIPTSDECCLVCCSGSIWIIKGDPTAGGGISNVSRDIGIVSHGAWCQTPEGAIIFLSHDGLYMMYARCSTEPPESLSRDRLPQSLLNLSTTNRVVNLAYDIFSRGVHIMVTPTISASTSGTVSVTAGVVTLSGSTFPAMDAAALSGGNKRIVIEFGGEYVVASRTDDTHLVLTDLTVNIPAGATYYLATATTASEHFFFDWKNRGFWPQSFAYGKECTAIHSWKNFPCSGSYQTAYAAYLAAFPAVSHPTTAAHEAVGNQSTVLIGCRDGYIRRFLTTQTTDDGTAIDSYLYYGPFSYGQGFSEGMVTELSLFCGLNSGDVTATIQAGSSGEEAFTSPLRSFSRDFTEARRNPTWYPRLSGGDFILLLEDLSNSIWSVERIDVVLAAGGRLRR
jgi:hypothetical protein